MLRRIRLALASVALALSACLISPYTDTEIASASTPVSFQGYILAPGQPVSLRSSPSPTGPYTEFATATSSEEGFELSNGTTVYPWFVTAVVTGGWSGSPCTGQDVYVRAYAGPFASQVYDGPDGILCIGGEIVDGSSTLSAIVECASEDSPNLHLTTPASGGPIEHTGDIVIADAADEATWQCLETLNGALSIPDSALAAVSLPALEVITGDADLVYTRLDDETFPASRTIDLPVLTTIGGTLSIESPAPAPSQNVYLDVGMNALTTLGGDLEVFVESFNVDMSGLDGLTSMTGALRFDNDGTGDTAMNGFLESLTTVGDVELVLGSTLFGVLEDLETVNGAFSMNRGGPIFDGFASDSFSSLTTVVGDFTLHDVELNGDPIEPIFPSLSAVGGTLTYRQTQYRDSLVFGAPSLSVGALLVEDNAGLTSVGGDNLVVAPTGEVSFIDNANLCSSSIEAFATGLPGWSGTLVDVGNAGC